MIGHAYLKLYPSPVLVISSMNAPEINLSNCEKTLEELEFIGATIEKPSHRMQ